MANKRVNVVIKKVDFFKADKVLSSHVVDFWKNKIVRAEYQTILQNKLRTAEGTIKYAQECIKDGSDVVTKQDAEKMILDARARIEEVRAEYKENLEGVGSAIVYTDTEKAFVQAVKKADDMKAVRYAVVEYFKAYNLDVSDTNFLSDVVNKCYSVKVDVKTYVKSAGTKGTINDTTSMLTRMIAITFEYMVQAGTIKAVQIPQVLRDKYAKKPKGKK